MGCICHDWHLDDGDSTATDFYQDATANNEHGTLTDADGDSTVAANGTIGGAYDFSSGDTDYIEIANFSQHLTTDMTISGWVKPTNTNATGHEGYFGVREGIESTTDYFYVVHLKGTDDLEMRFTDSAGAIYDANANAAVTGGTWVYITLTYDGDTLISYVDGQFANQNASATGGLDTAVLPFQIGADGSSGDTLDGIVDEVRASSTARSADWIEAEFNNQDDPSTFVIEQTPEDVTVSDTPTQTSGTIGNAQTFDNTDDHVNIPNSASLGITGDITISAWVKRNSSGAWGNILGKTDGVANWGYDLFIGTSDRVDFYADNPTPNQVVSADKITDTSWHHVAVTRTGSDVSFYIDGSDAGGGGSMTGAFNSNALPVRLGYSEETNSAVDGTMDEIRLSSAARSADWIAAQYLSMTDEFIWTKPRLISWQEVSPDAN